MHEVPGRERSLLALDEQETLTRQDEKRLLGGLGVVQQPRSGPEHAEVDSEVVERDALPLEGAHRSKLIVRLPRRIPYVDDEPTTGHGRET
jgi:hypothetical protein